MIKAIYLDFDGTLYSHVSESIPNSAKEALRLAKEKGIKIIMSTGRSKKELEWFDLSDISFDAYIMFNGLAIYDKDLNPLFVSKYEGILKQEVLRYFNKKEFPVWLATEDDCFLNTYSHHFDGMGNQMEVRDYKGEDIVMASIILDTEKQKEEVMKLGEYCDFASWSDMSYDLLNKGWSKIKGIEKINDYFGFEMDEAITIGDSNNDYEMLKECPNSVAMGNGVDSIKKISNYVTSDIDDDGIYNALKHFGVI